MRASIFGVDYTGARLDWFNVGKDVEFVLNADIYGGKAGSRLIPNKICVKNGKVVDTRIRDDAAMKVFGNSVVYVSPSFLDLVNKNCPMEEA